MNYSPIQYRVSIGGTHAAATLRIHLGPTVHDTRLISAGLEGSLDDPGMRERLRELLAEGLADSIRKDEWPGKA